MAKRKRKSSKASKKAAAPEHKLPAGFWRQVSAVFLIAVSILLVVAWFGAGGPVVDWFNQFIVSLVGYGVYAVPLLFVYLAVEIFRSENNQVPFVVKLAGVVFLVWIAGLFEIFGETAKSGGGWIGHGINQLMLGFVSSGVAAFIYVLLIAITTLFLVKVSPFTVISKIWAALQTKDFEEKANVEVMRKAAKEPEAIVSTPISELKLNKGVPIEESEPVEKKRSSRLSSFKNSMPVDKAAEERSALVATSDPNWRPPSLDLLEKKQSPANAGDVKHKAQLIRDTLADFNIAVEMEGANVGPKVTQYTLKPPSGVKLSRISALETNLALSLAAPSLRIEAPIPGQSAVGIEVPNQKAADVRLHGILTSKQWKNSHQPLAFAIGKDISGEAVIGELNKMPHALIAGQTGSGKSVMINTLLTSLLYRNSPSDMRLILVDPKGGAEMQFYDDIPHLLTPVITDAEKTISALKWAVNEMERRYKVLKEAKVRDIASYNKKARRIPIEDEDGHMQEHDDGKMPYIVIVIDELADLMMVAARDVETLIVRLTQKARAVGIHVVLATQRPSVNVITGLIKANVPARIAFTVAQQVDSRTILDSMGAEKLLGQGDMLLKTAELGKPKRIQGAWVMDEEVTRITDYLREQSAPLYNEEIISQPVQLSGKGGMVMDAEGGSEYDDAVRVVIDSGKASTSYLQRRLSIGYSKAARIIDEMEENGVIGPSNGSKPRQVLVSSMDELSDI